MKITCLLLLLFTLSCTGTKNETPKVLSQETINEFYDAVFADNTAKALKMIDTDTFPAKSEPKSKILPLQASIWQHNLLLVKALIEGGANVNPKDLSLIGVAAEKGNIEIIKYLISKGAEINPTPGGTFAIAANNNHYDCAKYLLLQGADPNLGEVSGKLSFFLKAVKNQDYEALDLLKLSKPDLDYNDCSGETAVIIAIKMKSPDMLKYLIEKGADKNKPETFDCGDEIYYGQTPLKIARKLNNESIINQLR